MMSEESCAVASLEDQRVADDPSFGGKAVNLARMTLNGVAVPQGVAISSSVFRGELARVLDQHEGNKSQAADVASIVSEMRVPDDVLRRATQLLTELSVDLNHLVVRSSAVGEDGATQSFAGQLDSLVDVGSAQLSEAIAAVWRSAFGARALHYRQQAGLTGPEALPVGVVIQALVEPARAGVMFTSSASGVSEGSVVIEAVTGRGDRLVDGSVSPSRYTWASTGLDVDPGDGGDLDRDVVMRLVAVGQTLEDVLNANGLDVEWVYANDQVSIVQARPITTRLNDRADPSQFSCHAVLITGANRNHIPDEMASKDKFRLRLIASRESVPISQGWLLTCKRGPGDGAAQVAAAIASQALGENQFSIVLQRPARLDGDILRRFSPAADLPQQLLSVIARVGATADEFDFIVTEVYKGEQSGISHLSDGHLYIEVGFGAYIPKGVVPTSLYVFSDGERLVESSIVEQEVGIFIEDGVPIERSVRRRASIDAAQAGAIRSMTQAVVDDYGDVSVEFGIRPSGDCYLIDIIPEGIGAVSGDLRVMSPGIVEGTVAFANSEALLARSLDAHFHSERRTSDSAQVRQVIVASRPLLALEEHLIGQSDGRLGFIFESGSLLGHLAIILREHRVPAIVVPSIRDLVTEGQTIRIDTSTQDLFEVVSGLA